MTLKTATLLAACGISIQLIWSLAMSIHSFQFRNMPPIYLLGLIPNLLFQVGLLLFFITLLLKQRSGASE